MSISGQEPMTLIRTLYEIPMVERVYMEGGKIVVVLKMKNYIGGSSGGM